MKWSTWTSTVVPLVFLFTLTACGGGGGNDDAPPATPFTVSGLNLAIKTLTGFFSDTFGAAVAINASGKSVGVADNGTTLQAVRWDTSGAAPSPIALMNLTGGDGYSAAYAINDHDVVVGESADGVQSIAVFWPAGSTMASPLPLTGFFPGGTSAAYGINENGEIVGEADADMLGRTVAVYWSGSAANPLILDNLSAGPAAFSSAYNINNLQVIIGEALSADGKLLPVVWLPDGAGGFGAPTALPLLPGHVEGVALDLNTADEIVGESRTADGTVHGVVWLIAATGSVVLTKDLGPNSSLDAINDNQLLGGYVNDDSGNDTATLWKSDDTSDSKEVTGAFSQAYGLNDSNWAVGTAKGKGFVAVPQ